MITYNYSIRFTVIAKPYLTCGSFSSCFLHNDINCIELGSETGPTCRYTTYEGLDLANKFPGFSQMRLVGSWWHSTGSLREATPHSNVILIYHSKYKAMLRDLISSFHLININIGAKVIHHHLNVYAK